jgi:selenium metabolism protein YedF
MVLDCRGLACPQPVVNTKKALNQIDGEELIIILDDASSCKNVERFVQSQGYVAEVRQRDQDFYIHVERTPVAATKQAPQVDQKSKDIVIYISSQHLGSGDEDLGSFLMKAFLKTLLDLETRPSRLILVNSGVQLAAEGSKVLETLQLLSEKGVEILCCGTCIEFYELKGKVRAGRISNMYEIIESMMKADRVIKP